MEPNSKWGKKYWTDLAERVGSTAVGAVLSTLVVTGSTPVDWADEKVVWAIIGVPTLVSLLKGLLVNLGGNEPTASVVNVTSTGE
jgi:hypothetical protein